jgi:hypothetical protein
MSSTRYPSNGRGPPLAAIENRRGEVLFHGDAGTLPRLLVLRTAQPPEISGRNAIVVSQDHFSRSEVHCSLSRSRCVA